MWPDIQAQFSADRAIPSIETDSDSPFDSASAMDTPIASTALPSRNASPAAMLHEEQGIHSIDASLTNMHISGSDSRLDMSGMAAAILATDFQNDMEKNIKTHILDVIRGTLDIIRNENVASESQQDAEFRASVKAEISVAKEKIRRVQVAAGFE